jgi:hypothetical protein
MKTFKEYLVENKKIYSFKIKVAGDVPEKFQEALKSRLDSCKVMTFEKLSTTPIQKLPLDFPGKENMQVTIYEVICEYPQHRLKLLLMSKPWALMKIVSVLETVASLQKQIRYYWTMNPAVKPCWMNKI